MIMCGVAKWKGVYHIFKFLCPSSCTCCHLHI